MFLGVRLQGAGMVMVSLGRHGPRVPFGNTWAVDKLDLELVFCSPRDRRKQGPCVGMWWPLLRSPSELTAAVCPFPSMALLLLHLYAVTTVTSLANSREV